VLHLVDKLTFMRSVCSFHPCGEQPPWWLTMGIEDDATIRNSIFLSAAHGWLENAERLLFGGCKAQMVFPSGSADSIETEFSAAVAEALGGIVQPEDVTIASIERDSLRGLHGAADHGGGAFTQRCHVVSFSISPGAGSPQGNFIRERILAPGFPAVVGRCIEAGIRASEQRDTLWDGVGSSVALLEESVQVWKSGANDRDCTGYSAMHWAALNNQIPVIKMLVRHGACLLCLQACQRGAARARLDCAARPQVGT